MDLEKIRTNIQFLSHDLNILDIDKEILMAEIKLAEELAPLQKAELDRFEDYVKKTTNDITMCICHLTRGQLP